MMHFHCLQHVPFEPPGNMEEWIHSIGGQLGFTRLYLQEPLPSLRDLDAIIIMGGPMSVQDEDRFPWLQAEKEFLKQAIGEGKKILGICLGAQLIAAALGSRVYPNREKEIGFMPVRFIAPPGQLPGLDFLPEEATVVHWHGDTFDLPAGAQLLASSGACLNQAYIINKQILALQFHPEVTPRIIEDMISMEGQELVAGHHVHSAAKIREDVHFTEPNKKWWFSLLAYFFEPG